MTSKRRFKKQKIVTVIGANYAEEIVPDLLEKSFYTYCKRDFSKKNFQVSVHENTHATSAVVLTVLGIEAYRNRFITSKRKKLVEMWLAIYLSSFLREIIVF